MFLNLLRDGGIVENKSNRPILVAKCGHYCGARITRGLCGACYTKYNALVKEGNISWEDLEKKGVCDRRKIRDSLSYYKLK